MVYTEYNLIKLSWETFYTILYNKLQNEPQKNIVLSPAQNGFRKDRRTSDHIFTLFSLINKYIKTRKYVYKCFVHFRKQMIQ